MQRQLEWARQRVEALEEWHKRLLEWEPRDVGLDLAKEEEQRLRGFRTNLLENFNSGPVAPPVFMVPGIKAAKYFDSSQFFGVSELEQSTDAIRTEFLAIAEGPTKTLSSKLSGLHAAQTDSGRTGSWSQIPLIRNGVVVEEFASRCPRTMDAVRKLELPKLSLISPTICFSILEPNSRITPHSGITNARLIAHLPLIVPENCGLRVGGEVREWEQGKLMVFDDMTVHEAWNDSDRLRVVLIADLWRPELSKAERAGIADLMDCRDIGRAS